MCDIVFFAHKKALEYFHAFHLTGKSFGKANGYGHVRQSIPDFPQDRLLCIVFLDQKCYLPKLYYAIFYITRLTLRSYVKTIQ
jgi:hypothetical protein